jgi:hypothetical protein
MTLAHAPEAIFSARSASIADELQRRGIKLRRSGVELIGPCPRCGGRDRFSVHLRKNLWLCRQCQAGGDVIELVRHLDGIGFAEAVEMLIGERPEPPSKPSKASKDERTLDGLDALDALPSSKPGGDVHRQAWALSLWTAAQPITGTIAETYLTKTRRLILPDDMSPRALRFHPACPFGTGTLTPCLLALFRDIRTDEPRAIHRTSLTPDARKIDRKMLGPTRGAAIKISDDADVTMGIVVGEGIESTIAGMMRGFGPAWALGSAGAIGAFPVLAGIDAVTVLGEPDVANSTAFNACAERWLAAEREAYRVTPAAGDFNDTLMGDAA